MIEPLSPSSSYLLSPCHRLLEQGQEGLVENTLRMAWAQKRTSQQTKQEEEWERIGNCGGWGRKTAAIEKKRKRRGEEGGRGRRGKRGRRKGGEEGGGGRGEEGGKRERRKGGGRYPIFYYMYEQLRSKLMCREVIDIEHGSVVFRAKGFRTGWLCFHNIYIRCHGF